MNYRTMGNFTEALIKILQCYGRRCIVLGKDHPDTLSCDTIKFIVIYLIISKSKLNLVLYFQLAQVRQISCKLSCFDFIPILRTYFILYLQCY